ncbi:YqaE/Pmp3 family membrane protein [Peribacillus sp. FSL H8-0477]|uniref:YqaE/Pmp3 family membrane protein n=1 Tax=Peribacillus sp. FSL H8-0477 TaxID=2921388 RepID=UPI0030FCF987
MMYLLAILLPPVAVLLSGKPVQAVLNLILCIFLWIPGVIHAILVVNEKKADKRAAKMYARSRQD